MKEFDLEKFYLETAEKIIKEIIVDVSSLDGDFSNVKKIETFSRHVHTLAGNSLQAEKYLVAFFCSKMENFLNEKKNGISKEDYERLEKLVATLEKYFYCVVDGKNCVIDENFADGLNEVIKLDYEEFEKKFYDKG